ncbi:MAG TPA: response regulator [Streptosporangiaceae bacterium]|nr:response regulator [Streptosporangiaceae bacterium]
MSEAAADAELADLFRDETTERLDQMDAKLLAIETGEGDAESVDSLFRHAHTIKGGASMLGFDDIRALAHAAEDVLAQVRETGVFPRELAAPLMRATSALRAMVSGSAEPVGDLLSELAACRAALADDQADAAAAAATERSGPGQASPPEPQDPPPAGSPPRPAVPHTPVARAAAPEPAGPAADATAATEHTLRVPAAKLDHLIDVTAEILEYRSRLTHALGQQQQLSQDVSDVLGVGGRLLGELRDTTLGLRMLPISAITGPLPRAVRDLARAEGKEVEFAVTGADTELDRVILESLSEPLTHLLRNAIVHGIETPAERDAAAKPPRGRVELRAVPHGSMVEIVVSDDGRGVSQKVIEAAGREGSLASLLTRPGYSTAGEVTSLAGRGVGLDAVKAYVNALGGNLSIRSQPGRGMDVILLLPLGLSLSEVLLFERGGEAYGMPLSAVEEVVTVTETFSLQGRAAVAVRGKSLPVTDIAAILGMAAPPLGDAPPAIVVMAGDRRAVITCDSLLGAGEVVVKPLGPVLANLADYVGAAVLGDGRIALLVASAALIAESPAGAARPEPDTAPDPAAVPRILVVEDSFSVRELQRSILETAGYPVTTARDGRDALAVLDRDSHIALVVTDIEMPGLDGIELTRAIRASAARSSLPVVIVTSHGSDEDRRRGIEAGADAYMAKSGFDQQTLLAVVARLVGR